MSTFVNCPNCGRLMVEPYGTNPYPCFHCKQEDEIIAKLEKSGMPFSQIMEEIRKRRRNTQSYWGGGGMIGDEHILDVVARHEATIAKQREVIYELCEELKNMATQYGCSCGHPACRGCRETKETWATIRKAEEVLG